MNTKTCLVVALLAGGSAAAQAERRPDWEQALALAPMVDAMLPTPEFAPADPRALRVPGFERHDVQALAVPPFAMPETVAVADTPLPHPRDFLASHIPLPVPEFALPDVPAQPDAELPAGAQVLPVAALALPGAEDLADAGAPELDGWQAVAGESLSGMRGGFTLPGGLVVSLGLERLVSINGEVVARTSFALPTTGAAGDVAAAARDALGGGLIQNGPGNISLATMAPEALGATIIQNTLNDQTIRSQTIINASVNSATLMQSLNFNDSLGQAIRNAIGSH